MSQCLQRKLSMNLKLDGVPRYFIKKVPRYRYSVPSTDGTGTKKVTRYFCTRYCSPMPIEQKNVDKVSLDEKSSYEKSVHRFLHKRNSFLIK